MLTALFVAIGYLFGSLPFGYWLPRVLKGLDIRRLGSGNIGATNVWRVLGRRYGVPVVLLDVAKGFVPTLLATIFVGHLAGALTGGAAMLGHARPLFLRFAKGGKAVATHNQRGRGTLYVGTREAINAEQLVEIVESSMSSPVYELLKRPDELFVVEHAHLQPRFVEDSVRHAIRDTLERYPRLSDEDFVLSRQVNLETIHTHDVLAERFGTVGELRAELETGAPAPHHTELREWLSA